MILSIKHLSDKERDICLRTISPKAIFALVGDAVTLKKGLSIVRMGDGEAKILQSPTDEPFHAFDHREAGWNERLGIEGLDVRTIQANIVEAGNTCTYFAPSVSGISRDTYHLYDHFAPRDVYFDNFFVNDWTGEMIKMLLEACGGAFIIHKHAAALVEDFSAHYSLPASMFASFEKKSWRDNEQATEAASQSDKQLVLFSAGPAGKVIGPRIAKAGKIVLDVGNTLPSWSVGNIKGVKPRVSA